MSTPAAADPLPAPGPDTPRRPVPAWITDPDTVASIKAGLYEIDDDLMGEK